jgi:hypothetical protein
MTQYDGDEALTKAVVAEAEHLKEYSRQIIYAFKDGAGHPDAPFTAELAVAAIWHKIDQAFEDAFQAYDGTLHFRLTVEEGAKPPALNDAVTCRCLGAAGSGVQVYYVVVKAANYDEAVEIVQKFVDDGASVRDWEYYAS